MKFSRLRLLGFKSFVEPGEFVIERGLTGIVGPNGCGKSNLVEALRWVMGESSYKNMRASGMDDVIFSGSGTRPARNTAEVTLFLDNSDRSAKDVQLLFADQSTGARSPSMVGQGRIGELIQAKPQARRALLEEAAGISGLHTRRHEAELRLKAAEQNLERLDDVVGELESQIESLKRQARQASRFKNLSADIRKAEATLLHLRWTLAKTQEGEARSALAIATALVGDRAAAQMAAAREQGISAHRLPELRDAEAAAAAAFQRLSIAKTQIDQGADVIYAAAGGTGVGVLQAAADAGKLGIGVDSNQNGLQPGKVLTSMVKRVDVAVYNTFMDAKNDKFTGGINDLGLKEGGVDYAMDDNNKALVDDAMKAAVEKAKADIIAGTVKVHDYMSDNACPY
ncbi:MAG: BMP family ABC transporter substrate-binding protein [Mesorhizobium sp.]|nr:MAG: BMP family ABC transporter substrate-binding protein [Mesorhizobium sp.]